VTINAATLHPRLMRRPEFHPEEQGVLRFYPRREGFGLFRFEDGATVPYSINKPDGQQIASGNATISDATVFSRNGRGDTSLILVQTPVIGELGEGYQCRFSYEDSVTGVTETRHEVQLFDVVRWPLKPSVTLSDLRFEDPHVDKRLSQILSATLRDNEQTAGSPETLAAVLAEYALTELQGMLRDAITVDERSEWFSTLCQRAGRRISLRPWAILDRERLRRVEALLAMKTLHRWHQPLANRYDERDELVEPVRTRPIEFYSKEADRAFRQLGRLSYDLDDLTADGSVSGVGSTLRARRVQSD